MKCSVCDGDLATLYFDGGWVCDGCYNQKHPIEESEPTRADLLARVKELEGENLRWRQDVDALQKRLHQRDTALVVARKALEWIKNPGNHKDLDFDSMTAFFEQRDKIIDHALSQIQACEVKK